MRLLRRPERTPDKIRLIPPDPRLKQWIALHDGVLIGTADTQDEILALPDVDGACKLMQWDEREQKWWTLSVAYKPALYDNDGNIIREHTTDYIAADADPLERAVAKGLR